MWAPHLSKAHFFLCWTAKLGVLKSLSLEHLIVDCRRAGDEHEFVSKKVRWRTDRFANWKAEVEIFASKDDEAVMLDLFGQVCELDGFRE